MGLLDGFPNGWLGLLQDPAQNPNVNGGVGADAANFAPPLFAPQTQRLPLSFAGPNLVGDFANWPPAQMAAGNSSGPFPDAARPTPGVQSSPYQSIGQSPPPAQNPIAHALRTKGVPETDIAAAPGGPERMQQLINWNFGPVPLGLRPGSAGMTIAMHKLEITRRTYSVQPEALRITLSAATRQTR